MDAEESGPNRDPVLKILTPQFAELFQNLRDDMDILFPKSSWDARMTAAVGALLSMKMEESVKVLKTPMKMVKLGPGGIIQPG